jgi:hypothetical protein
VREGNPLLAMEPTGTEEGRDERDTYVLTGGDLREVVAGRS